MNKYTDADRIRVLAALEANGGNVLAAVRETTIERSTVRRWWREHQAVTAGVTMVTSEKKTDIVAIGERWLRVEEKHLIRAEELVDSEDSLREVMVGAGIAADKHMDYTQGRKGATVTVDNRTVNVEGLTTDELRSLASGTR